MIRPATDARQLYKALLESFDAIAAMLPARPAWLTGAAGAGLALVALADAATGAGGIWPVLIAAIAASAGLFLPLRHAVPVGLGAALLVVVADGLAGRTLPTDRAVDALLILLVSGIAMLARALTLDLVSRERTLRHERVRAFTHGRMDALTGLPNERAALAAVERDLARAQRTGEAVWAIHLDVTWTSIRRPSGLSPKNERRRSCP